MSVPHVAILAGGIGERIRVLTGGTPKALLRLAGKHIIEYTLESLIGLGVRHVLMVVNNQRDFEDIAVKYGKYLEIEMIRQQRPEVEGAIATLKDHIRGDFMLLYGDVIAPPDMYSELMAVYRDGAYSVILVPEEELEGYVLAKLANSTTIEYFSDHLTGDKIGLYAVGGAYILPREFIDIIEAGTTITEALNQINNKYRLRPCIWSGWWIDIEYPWDLLRATLYVLHSLGRSILSSSSKISSKAVIEGVVVIEDDVEIDHYAVIKGPVYIGKKSYIGSYSLIRSFVSLEGGNTVGSYTEIVWSSIQRNVSIGSKSYIGFSVIGENSVIEPGVVTLNLVPEEMRITRAIKVERRGREYIKLGAIIGCNTRVKAGTVLKPGAVIA